MTIKALYPTVRPTLNLDFAKTKALDPRVTFTRASTATFVGSNGLIQTAASGAARFDHNPATGESLGLLVEEARTNLLLRSEGFDNAAWIKSNMAVTADATTSPGGSLTADLLYTTTSGVASAGALAGGAIGSSTPYTTSIYLKSAGFTWAYVYGAQGNTKAYFNLITGAIGTVDAGATAAISPAGNGWYKCSVTQTVTYSSFYVGPADANGSTTSTASGTSGIYVWGAQVEAGSFPTSYIPTTTATVTRAADVASMTGTNFSSWYRQDEGTMYLKAVSKAEQYLLEIPTTGGGNYHVIAINSARAQLATVNSTTQANIFSPVGSYNLNVANSVCAAWAQNSFAITSNGTTVANDTSGTVPTVDLLAIGRRNLAGLNYSCSTFARLTYYPVRLPDAQLQALTAT